MATDYGIASDVVTDRAKRTTLVSGQRNVANAIARRLGTPHGSLTAIDPEYGKDYGFDVRDLVNAALTHAEVGEAEASIEAECLKDDRVLAAEVALALTSEASSGLLTIDVETQEGPFTLVLAVSSLTVEILRLA